MTLHSSLAWCRRFNRGAFAFLLLGWWLAPRQAAAQPPQPVDQYGSGGFLAPYVPLAQAQPVVMTGGGGNLDDGFSASLPLPFSFQLGSTVFSSVTISTNGYLILGANPSPTNYQVWRGPDDHLIAFANTDLTGLDLAGAPNGATYSVITDGQTPDRIFKIQASNFQRSNTPAATGSAQIWLYETSNLIEIHFGAFSQGWDRTGPQGLVADTIRVGLRGASAPERLAVSSFGDAAFPNIDNSDPNAGMLLSNGIPGVPQEGRTYQFFPQLDFSGPDLSPLTLAPAGGACTASAHTVTVTATDLTGVASVELTYFVGGGQTPVHVPMTDIQGVWTATIPPQGAAQVTYYVTAIDASPNTNESRSRSSTYADAPLSLGAGPDQSLNVGNPATLRASVAAPLPFRITEFTLSRNDDGATPTYPGYIGQDDDFVEVTNLGPTPRSLAGCTLTVYTISGGKRDAPNAPAPGRRVRRGGFGVEVNTYEFLPSAVVPAGGVSVVHLGDGTDDPANLYYHLSTDLNLPSGHDVAFALTDSTGRYLDAVSVNDFDIGLFIAEGVGWTGVSVSSPGGTAGAGLLGADVDSAANWATATANAPQTIGTPNPGLVAIADPVVTWTGGVLAATTAGNPVTTPIHLTPGAFTYTASTTTAGCTATDQVTVTVTGPCLLPAPTLNYNTPVCEGQTLVLSAANVPANATYAWTGPNQFSSSNPNPSIPATAAVAGTYSLTITDGNGCVGTAALQVDIEALPAALGPNQASRCGPGAVTLNYAQLPPGLTVRWYDVLTGGQPLATGPTFTTPSLTQTTPYFAAAVNFSGCESASRTAVTATIVAPIAGTFSYLDGGCTGTPGTLTPTLATGATAGTFAALTSGLSLNPQTGAVDLALSQAGTYEVVNQHAANAPCPASADTATVEIFALPIATLTAGGAPNFCVGDSVVLHAGPRDTASTDIRQNTARNRARGVATGFTYAYFLNGILIPGATADSLVVGQSGSYTVTVTVPPNDCSGTSAAVAVVVSSRASAAFAYGPGPNATYCLGDPSTPTPTVTGTTGGTFSASPAGLSLNPQTGAIALSTSQAGPYQVQYRVGSTCPDSLTVTVTLTTAPLASFSYTPQGPVCTGAGGSLLPTLAPGASGGLFSSPDTALVINATTGAIDLSASVPGTYWVYNAIGASGACPAVRDSAQLFLEETPPAGISSAGPADVCVGDSVRLLASPTELRPPAGTPLYSYQFLLNGQPIAGAINDFYLATTSGNYSVVVTSSGGCEGTSAGLAVTIRPVQSAAFSFANSTYCLSATNPTPSITGTAGGTFSASGGLTINSISGEISLSTAAPGTYTVRYLTPGPCPGRDSATVTLTTAPLAGFSYAPQGPVCAGAPGTLTPALAAGAAAGTFSATPAGLSLNPQTGAVAVAASQAGTYTITNDVAAANGCAAASATAILTVGAAPTATVSASGPTTICASDSVTLTATSGASYLWSTGATTPTITVGTAGAYTVTVTNAAGCTATSAATTVVVTPRASAAFAYATGPNPTYCLGSLTTPTPSVSGTVGGTFSAAPTGLTLDPQTGAIDLTTSQAGTYQVQYTVGSACPDSLTITVTLVPAPQGAFAYPTTAGCAGGTATLAPALALGSMMGTFSATPAGLTLDPVTGAVTLATSLPGVYTIFNTVAGAGTCPTDSATATLTLVALPTVAITGLNLSYCSGEGPVTLNGTVNGMGGLGTFTIDGTAATVFDPATLAAGPHVVVFTGSAGAGCDATASLTVTVVPTPVAPAITPTPQASGVVILTSSAPTGNQWYLNGTAIPGATGATYSVGAAAQNGTYTVVSTVGGCASAPSPPQTTTVTGIAAALAGPSVELYPNPTRDGFVTLALPGATGPAPVRVFDATGREVLRTTWRPGAAGGEQLLDLRPLPTGVYAVRVLTPAGWATRRLVRE